MPRLIRFSVFFFPVLLMAFSCGLNGNNSLSGGSLSGGSSSSFNGLGLTGYTGDVVNIAPDPQNMKMKMKGPMRGFWIDLFTTNTILKVFGTNEPMSIFRNALDADMWIWGINQSIDSSNRYNGAPLQVRPAVTLPELWGQTLSNCYEWIDNGNGGKRYLYRQTASEQTVAIYIPGDNTYVFCGIRTITGGLTNLSLMGSTYKPVGGWKYRIQTSGTNGFFYSMIWAFPSGTNFGYTCISGGGDKSDRYILRVRSFTNSATNSKIADQFFVLDTNFSCVTNDGVQGEINNISTPNMLPDAIGLLPPPYTNGGPYGLFNYYVDYTNSLMPSVMPAGSNFTNW